MLINETHFKENVPVNTNFGFAQVKPDIRTVEIKIVKDILGATLYGNLDTAYNADTTTANDDLLLEYIHPALAQLALWMYLPKGNIIIDNQSVSVIHGKEEKPAHEWQVRDARKSLMEGGYNAIEMLIEYLEDNSGIYAWNTDNNRGLFINTAAEIQEFIDINDSRYMYLRMVPILKRFERSAIKANIGDDLFDEIKTQIKDDGEPSANNLKLMDNIRGVLAHLAYADLIYEKSLVNDQDGFHLINSSISGSVRSTNPAEESRLRVRRDHHREKGQAYLKNLTDYLHKNADTYTLYKESDLYNEDMSASDQRVNTESDKLITLGI